MQLVVCTGNPYSPIVGHVSSYNTQLLPLQPLIKEHSMAVPSFSFPFEPYSVQQDFAAKLYHCLRNSISGVFQSPTGTGKSLSVICAALKWVNEASAPVTFTSPSRLSFRFEGDFEEIEPMEGLLNEPRVIFCTRTHTQISQFIREIRLTSLPKGRIVALAAKKRLCIHSEALSSSDVSEYCLNLNRQTSSAQRCPYKSDLTNITNAILTSVLDIEDMQKAGRQCQQCPYYGMRAAAEQAKVVIAPYQYVLSRAIRGRVPLANGGTVVIVDEAHNVVETMLMCNSSERKIATLEVAKGYLREMACSLPALDALNFEEKAVETPPEVLISERKTLLEDLQLASQALHSVINTATTTPLTPASSTCVHPTAFLASCQLSPQDILQLNDRLQSYTWDFWRFLIPVTRKGEKGNLSASEVDKVCNAVGLVAAFAFEPANHRIILRASSDKVDSITHLLVNPVKEFEEILSDAKCVILTGGTLDPKEEFVRLFSSLPASRFVTYDFDHVAPADSLLLSIVSQGTDNQPLKLDYAGCRKEAALLSLSETVLKLCEIVPNGLVCFFPSFDYLKRFAGYISREGYQQQYAQFKAVIYDDRKTAFPDFTREAATPRGAVLFTVVRGSLSEGINFKHEIGRCVVVIGQPYPNIREAEVKAKMEYWDREGGTVTGAVYLSNVCFKAVNQCLGRVVRDRWDYAAAVLVDVRYRHSVSKLALWTRRNMVVGKSTGEVYAAIEEFFRRKTEYIVV